MAGVEVEFDGPALFEQVVVATTQGDGEVEVGVPAVVPVDQVVGVAPGHRGVASRAAAVGVDAFERGT